MGTMMDRNGDHALPQGCSDTTSRVHVFEILSILGVGPADFFVNLYRADPLRLGA
jgi:hypothetical protein